MSEHPNSRRFTEEEVMQIKLMTDGRIKPRQVLKALKQRNPELRSTPRHLYNLKAKIRLGSLSDKTFKSGRPSQFVGANASLKENYLHLKVPNFIGGKFLDSSSSLSRDIINPATQDVVCLVPSSTHEEFKAAVNAAKQAFPSWNDTPITTRQQIMFKFQELILGKIATNIAMEQVKALKGAQSDVLQGLEVVERACRVATSQMGEFISNSSNGIDVCYIKEPLGVCAGISCSNYPEKFSYMDPPFRVMPPISSASDSDLSNSGASSESPLLLPLPSENDHSNQNISPTIQRHETIPHVLEQINLPFPSRKTDLEGLIAAKSHEEICSTTLQTNKLAPFMPWVSHLSESCLFSPQDRLF